MANTSAKTKSFLCAEDDVERLLCDAIQISSVNIYSAKSQQMSSQGTVQNIQPKEISRFI